MGGSIIKVKLFMKWYRRYSDVLVIAVTALLLLDVNLGLYVKSNYNLIKYAEIWLCFFKISGLMLCPFQLLNLYFIITRKTNSAKNNSDEKKTDGN